MRRGDIALPSLFLALIKPSSGLGKSSLEGRLHERQWMFDNCKPPKHRSVPVSSSISRLPGKNNPPSWSNSSSPSQHRRWDSCVPPRGASPHKNHKLNADKEQSIWLWEPSSQAEVKQQRTLPSFHVIGGAGLRLPYDL